MYVLRNALEPPVLCAPAVRVAFMDSIVTKVLVACRTGDSGLTDYALCLIDELSRYGDVQFATAESALRHPARKGARIVPLFRRLRTAPLDALRLVRFVLRDRPDLVLFQSWMWWPLLDALVVRFLRSRGVRMAITVHDVVPHKSAPWSSATCALLFRSFDGLIAHSKTAHAQLKRFGVNVPVLHVPHGEYTVFDVDGLDRMSARAKLGGLEDTDFVILFFGHLDQRKGLTEFLEVAEQMKDTDVKFLIAGRNDWSGRGRAILEKRHGQNVRLDIGHVPFERVQEYFAACDVVALPYREGTTSGVAKIAIAFGKPIIASRVGDLPESLENWPSILIDVDDLSGNLKAAIVTLRAENANWGNAIEIARERFSWKRIGRQYATYLGLLRSTEIEGTTGSSPPESAA